MSAFQEDIAREIGSQLGGLRLMKVMLGAKEFMSLDANDSRLGGLKFRIAAIGRPRVNLIMIELQPNDLYRVSVYYGKNLKPVNSASDIFNDQLVNCIEGFINLSLRMPRFARASA